LDLRAEFGCERLGSQKQNQTPMKTDFTDDADLLLGRETDETATSRVRELMASGRMSFPGPVQQEQ
jgi:hypothetical protein